MAMCPVRCFICGKVIASQYQKYLQLCGEMTPKEAMDVLKVNRWCCRRMFLTNVDIPDQVLTYHDTHVQKDNQYIHYKPANPENPRVYYAR
jgi:DNA-directed RNA polymerase subunit N (RpoN/RPB10)